MFRMILSAAILPLEMMSVGISGEATATTWWLLGATVLTACPTAWRWAQKLFGEDEGWQRSPPG